MTTQLQRTRGPIEPEHYHPDNRWLRITSFVVLGVFFLLLLILAVATFRTHKTNAQASTRADQLISQLQAAGLPVPDKQQITSTLGDDGGAVCANPTSALTQAIARSTMMNGAAGPGQRPVIVPQNIVEGGRLIITIYCPDQLDQYNAFVNSQKYV
jgi:hypothetical protein